MKRTILTASLMVLISALVATSRAQDQPPQDDEQGPGAARISLIQGEVSTQRGDSGEWVATTVNAPLVRGDKIATGPRSRAEVQLDYAHVLRLGPNTEVSIADMTRSRMQLQVASGLADLVVYKGAEAEAEADTPNMAVHPLGEGTYRIQVDSPSETSMTVREGRAEVSTPQGSTPVDRDQIIYVKGTDNPEFRSDRAPALDAWDQWNRERDSQILNAKSWSHTNRYYTGSQDLD
ncbi:MAG: FecR family protein, partial [Acidobacteriia bacterium]|nr:FecR family protein [Terriglobia bacterium]